MNENKITRFTEITQEMAETYVSKNTDYGDSFSETVQELGIITAIGQIVHKTNRLKAIAKKGDTLVKDETMTDTLKDLANYAIMTMIEIEAVGRLAKQEENKNEKQI